MVDAPAESDVFVTSLQTVGSFGTSELPGNVAADPDTLLALQLYGETLHIDHGYPCRIIAPNRPGVRQTKWVSRMEVLDVSDARVPRPAGCPGDPAGRRRGRAGRPRRTAAGCCGSNAPTGCRSVCGSAAGCVLHDFVLSPLLVLGGVLVASRLPPSLAGRR